MELREYMSVRRAYNLVRQDLPADSRLTFEEFGILAHLALAGDELKTSEIAEYQNVLRPTMTHRTNHLARLGLINRHEGLQDRRNVCCSISDEGCTYVRELATRTTSRIAVGQPLHRIPPERAMRYVESMGSVFCTAGDLVLVGLRILGGEACTVTQLVNCLGLLQPTVSMSVSVLVQEGLVDRNRNVSGVSRTVQISLTEKGAARVDSLEDLIAGIIVRRRHRSSRGAVESVGTASGKA